MGMTFNSGMGGYTCDSCNTLLYAGGWFWNKDRSKDDRNFYYFTQKEDILEKEDKQFCSKECFKKFEEEDKRE